MKSSGEHSDRKGWRILIVGTGGQGVVTAARLLCDVFVEHGHDVVSGQLHGMAQRGGSVQSSVMIDAGVSPVIPLGGAHFVLGLEPVETARALGLMSSRTVVYMNTAPIVPFIVGQCSIMKSASMTYPDTEVLDNCIRSVTPRAYTFDATALAEKSGSTKTVNIIMLGCLLGSGLLPCTADDFWNSVAKTMPPRLAKSNTEAFARGAELGRGFRPVESKR